MAQDVIKGLITFDAEHQHGLYPYTETDCVFDADGNILEDLLNNQFEILWENPNSAVNFTSQTVSIDTSKYDAYYVVYRTATAYTNYSGVLLLWKNLNYIHTTIASNIIRNRSTRIVDGGVYFGDCTRYQTYGSSPQTDNSCLVPWRVYGVSIRRVVKSETTLEKAYTNPNPSSSFPLTTIDLDLSGTPKMLMFECRVYASSATVYKQCMTVPFEDGFYVMTAPRFDGSSNQIMGRSFRIQGNQVVAQTGYSMGSYGSMGTTNNNAMIPLNIYAIY